MLAWPMAAAAVTGLGGGSHPVRYVGWVGAQAYVAWLSRVTGERYRLPSESEWEYAARAGSETKYSWGNEIGSSRANCGDWSYSGDGSCGDPFELAAPVGSFPPNAFGLHDMHGNVGEWVEDCRNDSYAGAPADGSAWLSGYCDARIWRGGGSGSFPRWLRSASRHYGSKADPDNIPSGFRVARTLAP